MDKGLVKLLKIHFTMKSITNQALIMASLIVYRFTILICVSLYNPDVEKCLWIYKIIDK